MKKVLGIHAVGHDSGAALAIGGKVVSISEERLTRKKHCGGLPNLSVEYVLSAAGIDLNDVDLIVFDILEDNNEITYKWIIGNLNYKGRIHAIRHHDAHAAAAFFASPFDEAAVLIVDAFGSRACDLETGRSENSISVFGPGVSEIHSFYRGGGNRMPLIRRTYSTPEHSIGIGILYALTSVILGFNELDGGKTMGLASFGGRTDVYPHSIFDNMNGDIVGKGLPEKNPLLHDFTADYAKWLYRCAPRKPGDPITKRHAEIAAYAQREAQWVMLELARHAHEITRSPNLCLSGGVALNSIANKLLLDEGPFEQIFIQPAASDTGTPLGCALFGLHVILGEPREYVMKDIFLGKSYSDDEIEKMLQKSSGIKWTQPKNIHKKCAELISEGKTVGWFRGGSELGPRALGHRSILADPRNPGMKDHLNASVKHREPFRPYAPAVLEDKYQDYFEMDRPSPFMLYVAKAKPDKSDMIPAVLHIDGTARLQTVNKEFDSDFYKLIKSFEAITEIPMILNTSFNDAGEPIVETPEDAVSLLLRTGLDYLAIESYLVEKL